MRMVYREYASSVEALKKLEAQIARLKTLDPVPAEDLVAVERRQQEILAIIAFKIRALDLLMTAAMTEDKEFVCSIGPKTRSLYVALVLLLQFLQLMHCRLPDLSLLLTRI